MKNLSIIVLSFYLILILPAQLFAQIKQEDEDGKKAWKALREKNIEEDEKRLLKAVEEWLSLVDDEKYAESWENASEFLRSYIIEEGLSKEEWISWLARLRKNLSKPLSRKLKAKEYVDYDPIFPDGPVYYLEYETSFGKKQSKTESIVLMLEEEGLQLLGERIGEGEWKVVDYEIY